MSTNVTETDTFPANVPTPVLGDKFTYPTTIPDALTRLASRTRWHENTLNGLVVESVETVAETDGTVFPTYSELATVTLPTPERADVVRAAIVQVVGKIRGLRASLRSYAWGAQQHFMNVPIEPVAEHDGVGTFSVPGTTWVPFMASNSVYWLQQTTPGSPPFLVWYIKGLPPTGTINQIACSLQGETGHAGLPSSMPSLTLYRQVEGLAAASVAVATDTSVNTTAYQAAHLVSNSSFTEAIQPNARYYLVFKGEVGTNALGSLRLRSSYISITTNA